MTKLKKLSLFLTFLFISNFGIGQSLIITGANTARQSISIEDLYFVTIQDNRDDKKPIFLQANVVDNNNQVVFRGQTKRFDLPSGNLRISELNFDQFLYPVIQQFVHPSVKKTLSKTGKFPKSNYQVCISAVEAEEHIQLTDYCYSIRNSSLSILQPVSPFNNTTIEPNQPVFTWTAGMNDAQLYDFVLVEMLGKQSVQEAVRKNTPIYEVKNLSSSVYLLPSFIALEKCKKYAWKVTKAGDKEILKSSEIFSFKTKCSSALAPNNNNQSYAVLKKQLDGGYILARNGILKFKFDEPYYQEANTYLDFKIKDKTNNSVPVGINELLIYGDNRYELNLTQLDPDVHYTLEITDSKKKQHYLKFKTN